MQITKITVSKSVPSDADSKNPQWAKAELSAELYPQDDYEKCKSELLVEVDTTLGGLLGEKKAPTRGRRGASNMDAEEEPKEEPKKRTRRGAAKKEEEPASEEPAEEKPKRTRTRGKAKEEPKEDEPKEEPKKRTRSRGKAAKPKITPYDRENEDHQNLMLGVLTKEYGEWENDEEICGAIKPASVALNGSDFLDADGNVLESFTDAFCGKIDEEIGE